MAFYQRIRDLREDADKTQQEVAAFLGTTAQYYGKYEKGERELPFSRAIELAEYYGVSLDYLAGRTKYQQSQTLAEDEQALLHRFRGLTERDKGKVEYLLELLYNGHAEPSEI